MPGEAVQNLGIILQVILLNYNGGWSLVQRFYSVKNEKEARKTALLAAALNIIGPPLFFLPVMLGRQFLPAPENTRYAYVEMALDLLPVGMTGVMITAMFAATMSALSSEYNVLASVATTDIYQRLFRPKADDRSLVKVGRVFTAVIGLIIMAIAIWITFFPDSPLFNMMVTIYGLAVAPMMLPLLGGLIFRSLTWKGALTGFVVGVISGFTMLGIRTYYLPTIEGLDEDWVTLQFGAYSIFVNVATTALAMLLYTWLEKRDPAEVSKIQRFFERMNSPIEETGGFVQKHDAPAIFHVVGIVIAGVGLMLVTAAFFPEAPSARLINGLAGVVLLLIGWLFARMETSRNDRVST